MKSWLVCLCLSFFVYFTIATEEIVHSQISCCHVFCSFVFLLVVVSASERLRGYFQWKILFCTYD